MARDPKTSTILYKILTPEEEAGLPDEGWNGTALDIKDGYFHLSTTEQIAGVLQRFFAPSSGAGDHLILCALPRDGAGTPGATGIEAKLKFDPVGHDVFGHVYGTIDPAKDFAWRKPMHRGADGIFELPSDLIY